MRTLGRIAALLFIALFAGSSAAPGARETDIAISGSSTVMPLAELSAEELLLLQNCYHVSVASGGTGVGIVDVAEGRSKIAMASREVKPVEQQRYESADRKFEQFLVGYDAICLVVSPKVFDSGVASLTREQVREIYTGEITNWKRVGGPNKEIFAIGRKAGSGTRDTFNEVILGSIEAEVPGEAMEASDSSEVKTAIMTANNAIGYVGYSFVLRGDTKVVSLDGVSPTIENIKKGLYPLARKLYFYTLGDPAPGPRAFMEYLHSPEGQKIAVENGFIPS